VEGSQLLGNRQEGTDPVCELVVRQVAGVLELVLLGSGRAVQMLTLSDSARHL
jgi:hypothetical protein